MLVLPAPPPEPVGPVFPAVPPPPAPPAAPDDGLPPEGEASPEETADVINRNDVETEEETDETDHGTN